jgi:two-component system, LytTR family, sensor kinase
VSSGSAAIKILAGQGVHALLCSAETQAELAKDNARLTQLSHEAQLRSLDQKLGRHFLFNALNSIKALIGVDAEVARGMVVSLSALLRTALEDNAPVYWSLREELDIVRLYLQIEQLRFADRLTTSVESGPELDEKPVPRLSLLPLVENAITHGVAQRAAGGHVSVQAIALVDGFELLIENEIRAQSVSGLGLGLTTLRERLALSTQGTAALETRIASNGRYVARVRFFDKGGPR